MKEKDDAEEARLVRSFLRPRLDVRRGAAADANEAENVEAEKSAVATAASRE